MRLTSWLPASLRAPRASTSCLRVPLPVLPCMTAQVGPHTGMSAAPPAPASYWGSRHGGGPSWVGVWGGPVRGAGVGSCCVRRGGGWLHLTSFRRNCFLLCSALARASLRAHAFLPSFLPSPYMWFVCHDSFLIYACFPSAGDPWSCSARGNSRDGSCRLPHLAMRNAIDALPCRARCKLSLSHLKHPSVELCAVLLAIIPL